MRLTLMKGSSLTLDLKKRPLISGGSFAVQLTSKWQEKLGKEDTEHYQHVRPSPDVNAA